jgi:hypothetical protein
LRKCFHFTDFIFLNKTETREEISYRFKKSFSRLAKIWKIRSLKNSFLLFPKKADSLTDLTAWREAITNQIEGIQNLKKHKTEMKGKLYQS